MLNDMVKTNVCRIAKPTRHLKAILGLVGGLSLLAGSHAFGQAVFTTQSDFTGWTPVSPGTASTASGATFDYDGSTTNGTGNLTAVGGTSTGGSLLVTFNSMAFSELAQDPANLAVNNSFMQSWDPGSVTAFSPASGFGPGSTVAYSGTIYMVWTQPSAFNGNFIQMGLNFDYAAGGFYSPQLGNSVSDGTVDGQTTFTDTIPYTVSAGAGNLSNLQFLIQTNSDSTIPGSMFIDDISFSPPVEAVVPEPATLGILGAGLTMLMVRRRRQTTI